MHLKKWIINHTYIINHIYTNKSLIFIQENIFYFNSPFLLRSVLVMGWNIFLVMGWNIFLVAALLKSLYSDTNILSKYIPSLQKKL